MVESVMFIAIGFLLGGLAALAFMPLVHDRAVRLTQRRLEADLRPSRAEVQCHKDLLRAQFAVAMRPAELSVEQMRHKLAAQLVEAGKRSEQIDRLKSERNALRAELGELKKELATRIRSFRPAQHRARLKRSISRHHGDLGVRAVGSP